MKEPAALIAEKAQRSAGVSFFRAVERKQTTMFLHRYISVAGNSNRNIPRIPHFPLGRRGMWECGECRAPLGATGTVYSKNRITSVTHSAGG
jgi:hypothetical protein